MYKIVLAFAIAFALPAWAEPDWVNAEVRSLDPEKSRIVLKHERINSIGMDSMTMKFDVNKSVSLSGLRAGDAVRFQVIVRSDRLEVIALEKRP
jgi:Cu/Ag efflux protein CusF